eukprot:scaffold9496_cov40-Attheya_sp.AAC.2
MTVQRAIVLASMAIAMTASSQTVNAFVPLPTQSLSTIPLHLWGFGQGKSEPTPPTEEELQALDKGLNTVVKKYAGVARPQITSVEEIKDFLEFLGEDDRLCVVKFHASWCKSCQKFGIRYKKLALQEGDKIDRHGALLQKGRVRFAQVEFTANADLCRTLGVHKLPYIHIYSGSKGRVADFACGPKNFPLVIEKMNKFLDKEMSHFDKTMEAGSTLGDQIATELQDQHFEEAASKVRTP